jgi:hypothetical protein
VIRRLRELETAAARWEICEQLVASRGWPDRCVIALERALAGYLDRAGYAAEAGISPMTANLDLRRLLDAGLVVQEGRGRATRYRASSQLRLRIEEGGDDPRPQPVAPREG